MDKLKRQQDTIREKGMWGTYVYIIGTSLSFSLFLSLSLSFSLSHTHSFSFHLTFSLSLSAQEWRNRTVVGHEPLICNKMCFSKTELV